MDKLYVGVAIDCEATQPAIQDKALGERAVRGVVGICEHDARPGTLFVIPTDFEASAEVYREAEQAGWELGLHVHPRSQGFPHEFMGVYGPDQQREILTDGIDRFADVFQRRPTTLCLGYNSANDFTYGVIVDLGFTHGQCCLPGRKLPECGSVWAGAPLDMHYAHAHNRLLPGDLDFVETPATVDPESMMWGGKHPQDLRVELVDAKNHWYTMDKAIRRQLTAATRPVCLRIKTHNIFEYSDPQNFRRMTLEGVLKHAKSLAETHQLEPEFVTGGELARLFRAIHPHSDTRPQSLELDRRGYGK